MAFQFKTIQDYIDFLAEQANNRTSMSRSIVIFHHSDVDGGMAGAAMYKMVPDMLFSAGFVVDRVNVVSVNYGAYSAEEVLDLIDKSTDVFVVDFAFEEELSDKIAAEAGFFVTIDHHATSEAKIGHKPYAIFDMKSSGALMAWNWTHPGQPVPLAVTLADNRDLWAKTDGREDQFHEAVQINRKQIKEQFPEDKGHLYMSMLIEMMKDHFAIEQIKKYGDPVIAKRDANIAYVAAPGSIFDTVIGGHPAVIVNYGVDQSDACEYLYNQPEHEGKIVAAFAFKHGKVNFSLRKNKKLNVNLGQIAERHYGGGGHAQAAGFNVSMERAINIIQNKEKWALCIDAAAFDALPWDARFEGIKDLELGMYSRATCEKDPSLLQLLPYITLVTEEGEVFCYTRPATGTETRLHGDVSIGLGGHMDSLPEAGVSLGRHIGLETARELVEEVGFDAEAFDVASHVEALFNKGEFNFIRLKNTDVEKVHLGMNFIIEVKKEWLKNIEESEVANPKWVPILPPAMFLAHAADPSTCKLELWSETVLGIATHTA